MKANSFQKLKLSLAKDNTRVLDEIRSNVNSAAANVKC